MIASNYSVLPHDALPKAVALTYAEIIRKGNAARSETPYANAFCRFAFGKSRPNKSQLKTIAASSCDTVPQVMCKLDRFLASNGEDRYLVSSYFADQAFPSKAVNRETRSDNHIAMTIERNEHIRAKASNAQHVLFEQSLHQIESVAHNALPEWVRNHEDDLSEHELKSCLQHWYSQNRCSHWSFYDLYNDMSASRTALDLSFDD